MDRGDRRLDLILADPAVREGAIQERRSSSDLRLIPQPTILLRERDRLAVGRRPGGTPGIEEQHEREQAGNLRLVRELVLDHGGEADRLVR